ncbi:MAG: hypothetical protein CSA81_12155 [Acidobacteria bacterium]|nr:MAG: hypothetical protein CSA81_12155 [Acidobacteriota bacterium]PIE88939.1 MAG: hypothetical protein CR997_13845 [Acidobacteriota bacterium]
MKRAFYIGTFCLLALSCSKKESFKIDQVPGNTLIIEFVSKVKYVISLEIDGVDVPIKYSGKNKQLVVKGLKPGTHHFNINSISYVFGPEFSRFTVSDEKGAYAFIQARKYRSALPKEKKQVSIRAYRKSLKKEGVSMETEKGIHAAFR